MRRALVFWFTGLSGSGKTTVAQAATLILGSKGFQILMLDGDEVRKKLHRNLGFSPDEIKTNNELIARLCHISREEYDVILVPIISPYTESRQKARALLGAGFYEVYFDANLDCVMSRDAKGLYAKARSHQIENMIGFSPTNPYQAPPHPDFTVCSGTQTAEESSRAFSDFCLQCLQRKK